MQKDKSKSNNTNVVANAGAVRCAIDARCLRRFQPKTQIPLQSRFERVLSMPRTRAGKLRENLCKPTSVLLAVRSRDASPLCICSKRPRKSLAPSIVFWSQIFPALAGASTA